MTANSSIFLIPLVAAFVLFLGKVYGQERAVTRGSLSFALAVLSVLLLFSYLALNVVLAALPPFTGVAYGVVGVILVGVAVLLIRVY
jgi:hypothetical protein